MLETIDTKLDDAEIRAHLPKPYDVIDRMIFDGNLHIGTIEQNNGNYLVTVLPGYRVKLDRYLI